MYGKNFIYNNIDSEDFDLVIGGFQITDVPLNLKRTTVASQMNRFRHRVNVYGINYESVLTFDLYLMKDPCKYTSQDELRFTRQDISAITSWLTSPNTPRLFHMYNYDSMDDPEYDYMGIFTNVEASDNHIYVLHCVFECNMPYALSPEQIVDITEGSGIVTNPSDELEDYVYPIITITPTESGLHTITLTNETDGGKSLTLKRMKNQDTVTIDCQKLTIRNFTGSLISFDDVDYEGLNYIYWPRLLHGDNEITVTNNAEVQFRFRYPVKVGAY